MILYMSDSEYDREMEVDREFFDIKFNNHLSLIKDLLKYCDWVEINKFDDGLSREIRFFKTISHNQCYYDNIKIWFMRRKKQESIVHKYWAHNALAPKFERGICDKICSYL
jgi:hypothetical protein